MFITDESIGALVARQRYRCDFGQYVDEDGFCRSEGWYYWGRWVLLAVVVVLFFGLFLSWSIISNRRRRSRGLQPRYGTGWMMPGQYYPNQQPQPQYNNGGWFGLGGNKNNEAPPPQYAPNANPIPGQHTGHTFNPNEGYYGNHANDVPLQQPSGSYHPRGGDPVYEPPAGAPPAKN